MKSFSLVRLTFNIGTLSKTCTFCSFNKCTLSKSCTFCWSWFPRSKILSLVPFLFESFLKTQQDTLWFSADKRVVKLPVKDATSSNIWSNSYLLAYSYDENAKTFFHAKDAKIGWAKYHIKKAFVRLVRLQNRPDCCCKLFFLVVKLTRFATDNWEKLSKLEMFNLASNSVSRNYRISQVWTINFFFFVFGLKELGIRHAKKCLVSIAFETFLNFDFSWTTDRHSRLCLL